MAVFLISFTAIDKSHHFYLMNILLHKQDTDLDPDA